MGYVIANKDGVSLWQEQAACRGMEPGIFFSDESSSKPVNMYKKICDNCPVRGDCLDYALIYNMSGVWGGTTDKDRRKLKRSYINDLREDYRESGMYNPDLKL